VLIEEIQQQFGIDFLGSFNGFGGHFNGFLFRNSVGEFLKELNQIGGESG
jgi:hypothetical protein